MDDMDDMGVDALVFYSEVEGKRWDPLRPDEREASGMPSDGEGYHLRCSFGLLSVLASDGEVAGCLSRVAGDTIELTPLATVPRRSERLMDTAEFCRQRGILLVACVRHETRDDGIVWDGARHWHVTIGNAMGLDSRNIDAWYSQGGAHTDPPTVAEVVGALASDAGSADGLTLSQFEREMGFEVREGESICQAAERIRGVFLACLRARNDLSLLLGDELMRELMACDWL